MTGKKHEFKYGTDQRPLRFSPNAHAAAVKTFGEIHYTVGNPPKEDPAAAAEFAADDQDSPKSKPV